MAKDDSGNPSMDLCYSSKRSPSPKVQNIITDVKRAAHDADIFGLQNLMGTDRIQEHAPPPVSFKYNVYNVVCTKNEHKLSLTPEDKLKLREIINTLHSCQVIDDNCTVTLKKLGVEEKELLDRMQQLEIRHHDGLQKLHTMEGVWASCETAYKDKLKLSKEKQHVLAKQINFVNESIEKYRNILKIKEIVLDDLDKRQKTVCKAIKDAEKKIALITEDIKQYKEEEKELKQKKSLTEDAITKKFIQFDEKQSLHRTRMKSLDKQVIEEMDNKEKKIQEMGEELNIRRAELIAVKRQLQEELLRLKGIKREKSIKDEEKLKRNINEKHHNGIHSHKLYENGYTYACTDMCKRENYLNNGCKNTTVCTDCMDESQKESFECACNLDEPQFVDSTSNMKDCPSDDNISFERFDSVKQNLLSGIYDTIKTAMKGALQFQNSTSDKNNNPVMIKVKNGELGKIDKSTKSALQNMLMDQLHINLEDFITSSAAKEKLKQVTEKLAKDGISEKVNCSLSLKLSLDSVSKETASIGQQFQGESRKQQSADVDVSTTDLLDPKPLHPPMNSPISRESSSLQFYSAGGSPDRHAKYLADVNRVPSINKSMLWASLRLNDFTPRLKVSPLQNRFSTTWQRPTRLRKRLSPLHHRYSPTHFRFSPLRLKTSPLRHPIRLPLIDRQTSPSKLRSPTPRKQPSQQRQQQPIYNKSLANGEPKSNRIGKYSEQIKPNQKRPTRNVNPIKNPIVILASARTIKKKDAGIISDPTRYKDWNPGTGPGRPPKGRQTVILKDPQTDNKVYSSKKKR